jgi:DMSO/TMAO reductase YedYZ molybdopterin-dependent catalytic subunit
VRLIAPGWYGVANVKWLTRIEVRSQRYAGRFMARDYVTIREEERGGETVWTFATVNHDRLKSAPAKVTRRGDQYAIMGAAWGAPIRRVEVRIDDGPWLKARLKRHQPPKRKSAEFAWTFWRLDWGTPASGPTRSPPGRSTSTAINSRRRMIPSWPASEPTGKATGRSPVE